MSSRYSWGVVACVVLDPWSTSTHKTKACINPERLGGESSGHHPEVSTEIPLPGRPARKLYLKHGEQLPFKVDALI